MKDKRLASGRHSQCKACKAAHTARLYDPERQRIYNKKRTPEQRREYRLQKLYGIDHAEYERILEKQNGKCAICKSDDPKNKGYWSIDHDHETGVVRGILCSNCNVGLGCFFDNTDYMSSAINYIESSRQSSQKDMS